MSAYAAESLQSIRFTGASSINYFSISKIVMSKTQEFKTKYIAYGIKSKHKCTAKQALNKMFKTYLKILSF